MTDAATPPESVSPLTSTVEAGEHLIALLRAHVDAVSTADEGPTDDADSELWTAVAAYGDQLDVLYGEVDDDDGADPDEPDELVFTVRTRYDYTVLDEKAFLAGGRGIAGAVESLLQRAGGKPVPALEVAALETGSGLVTVHLNDEPLTADDFADAEEPTDLLLVDPDESLQFVLDEPVYASRLDAENAARRARN
ncbi:MAG: hypothetical protein RI885_414 [Actinomycetota bacterium]|jgi:hypothetical protein